MFCACSDTVIAKTYNTAQNKEWNTLVIKNLITISIIIYIQGNTYMHNIPQKFQFQIIIAPFLYAVSSRGL